MEPPRFCAELRPPDEGPGHSARLDRHVRRARHQHRLSHSSVTTSRLTLTVSPTSMSSARRTAFFDRAARSLPTPCPGTPRCATPSRRRHLDPDRAESLGRAGADPQVLGHVRRARSRSTRRPPRRAPTAAPRTPCRHRGRPDSSSRTPDPPRRRAVRPAVRRPAGRAWCPPSTAVGRSTPSREAPRRSASRRFVSRSVAPSSFAPRSTAPYRSDIERSASRRSSPLRSSSARLAPRIVTPRQTRRSPSSAAACTR